MAYCTNCGTEEVPGQQFCPHCGTATSGGFAEPGTLPYFPMDPPRVAGPPLAGYWWRVLGFLIDNIILGLAINLPLRSTSLSFYTLSLINVAVVFAYATFLLSRMRGQTFGMMVARVRCVNAGDLQPVTLAQAAQRTALYCVVDLVATIYHYTRYLHPNAAQTAQNTHHAVVAFLFFIPLLVDLLWPAWDKRNQTLHDKIAGTLVLRPPVTEVR
ncbi:MAG: RDD family protein [Acidimicrobiales bacterium]